MSGGPRLDPEAEHIRRDIEDTRARMGETIEALGERLNPSRLTQQMKDNLRDATIGRVKTMAENARQKAEASGRGILATVRENPIPAAMVVGGLAWLMFGRRHHGGEEYAGYAGMDVDVSVEDDGESVAQRARAATSAVSVEARHLAARATERTSAAAHRVADAASSAARQVSRTYDENPLILGAFAAAAGLAIGLSIPATETESRLMGDRRDAMMDAARERIQATADRARHAAERAVPEVKEALKTVAREEGLAP